MQCLWEKHTNFSLEFEQPSPKQKYLWNYLVGKKKKKTRFSDIVVNDNLYTKYVT